MQDKFIPEGRILSSKADLFKMEASIFEERERERERENADALKGSSEIKREG